MTTQEKLSYGIDYGREGGDKTAISIVCNGRVFSYVGEEAEAIIALINQAQREAAIEELEWADNKFDSLLQATEDGDRVHPGEYYEAIEDRIKALKEGK